MEQIEFPQTMNALTVWQPWATLLAKKLKLFETRRQASILQRLALTQEWFAIHAAASTPASVINEAIEREPIKTMLALHGISRSNRVHINMPQGAILAVARIGQVEPTSTSTVNSTERALGDYAAGAWVGHVKDVIELHQPVMAKGAQGLWSVPIVTLEQVLYQLREQGAGVAARG
jgi:activating signal cointegrator 1